MGFIIATLKNASSHGVSPEEAEVKAFQVTEENKDQLGAVVAGTYYVTRDRLEQLIVPEQDQFSFTLELYSDTHMIRAKVGDWFVLDTQRYKIVVEWVEQQEFESVYDFPAPLEPPVIDREIPDHVVDEIIPEVTDGAV